MAHNDPKLCEGIETATEKFSAAVAELRRKMGTVTKIEYKRLDRPANEARVKSEAGATGSRTARRGARVLRAGRFTTA
jgi:hypothetical protein